MFSGTSQERVSGERVGFASVCFFRGNIEKEKCEKAGGRVNPCRSRVSAPPRGPRAPSSREENEDESETGSLALLASHQQKQCKKKRKNNQRQEESLAAGGEKPRSLVPGAKPRAGLFFSHVNSPPPQKKIIYIYNAQWHF